MRHELGDIMIWAISRTATSLPTAGSGDNDVLVWYRLCRPPRRGGAPISLQSRPRMPILIIVVFFMVRPAFPSAIERRTAPRSMWWYDPVAYERRRIPDYAKGQDDDWNREVVQHPKRLRLHSAGGRIKRCVRAHLGGRALRHRQFARRPATELRAGTR